MTTELTPQQQAAAYTTGAHLCVDAGAGSGKTTVLVERVMNLLDRGVALRRIVAITFTRKAAGEMKERLRGAIHRRPQDDPRSMDKWRAIELEVETARITTIDGFCASLLHENALRIGLDPDFTTLGEEEAPLLRSEVAETTLISLLDREDAGAHRLVVEHGLESVTSFLSATLDQSLRFDEAARPYAGLDAAGLAQLWKTQADEMQRARFEALAVSPELHRIAATLAGLAGECRDTGDKIEVLRRDAYRYLSMLRESGNLDRIREGIAGLCALGLQGGSAKAWSSKEAMQAVKAAADEARDLAKDLEEPAYSPKLEVAAAQLTLDAIAVFSEVARHYREAKQARAALDFGDLLALTLQMLRDQPGLRARIAGGISHLLIDEFQDTNHAQLALAELLAAGGGAELFVVGDAKQSVYRFRGAEVEVFAQVKQWTRQTLRLDENFRSVAPLIAFINDFFREGRLLAHVEPDFQGLTATREAPAAPCIEFLVPEDRGAAASDPEEGAESDSDRSREAALLAGRIAELCGPGGAEVYDKPLKAWRPARFGDVAILYRAGSHANVYEEALRRKGIPANVIAGSGFYARQEILDLHNLFTAALDPWNEPALAAFLRSPLAGVTDDTLMRLTHNAKLAAAFSSGGRTGDTAEDAILDRARRLMEFVQQRREWPVAALLREILAESGFEAVLLSQYHGVQKAGNVHKLIDLARSFGGAGRLGLHAFTQYLSSLARNGLRAGDAELLAAAGGAVTLMTVHKAKGLEFPIVAIVEMGRAEGAGGRTPIGLVDPRHGMTMLTHDDRGATAWPALGEHLRRHDKENDRAEEARVLYVAMTRARDRLLLCGPAKPKKNSWMAAMNSVFAPGERKHGAPLSGAAWEARIVRHAASAGAGKPRTNPPSPAIGPLLLQAAALPLRIAPGQIIPVHTLLDRMHPSAPAGPIARDRGDAALDRRLLGTAAHAMLERWNFSGDPPIAEVARECFPTSIQTAQCMRELDTIAARLQRSNLWRTLTGASSLRKELPFLLEVGGVFLNGIIDLLLDGETLIDYKLGPPENERSNRHRTQLRVYAAAIRAAVGRAPKKATLYYLESGDHIDVDVRPAILDETLERARAAL